MSGGEVFRGSEASAKRAFDITGKGMVGVLIYDASHVFRYEAFLGMEALTVC